MLHLGTLRLATIVLCVYPLITARPSIQTDPMAKLEVLFDRNLVAGKGLSIGSCARPIRVGFF